jgi:predicted chitinase
MTKKYLSDDEPADSDNITKVILLINGGKIGLAERMEWLRRVKNKLIG